MDKHTIVMLIGAFGGIIATNIAIESFKARRNSSNLNNRNINNSNNQINNRQPNPNQLSQNAIPNQYNPSNKS